MISHNSSELGTIHEKTLATVALAGILTLSAGAASAQAAPYPAPATGTVSSSTVTAGSTIVFTASGFTPGETVTITVTFNSPVAGGIVGGHGGGMSASVPMIVKAAVPAPQSLSANASGTVTASVTLTDPGTYTITAKGATSGVSVSQVVKVTSAAVAVSPANNASGSDLASTGVDGSVVVWSLIGAGALAAGAGTVVVSRRRSRKRAEA
ncbi:MAG: LPXTG cell wall anchor domain-containing protein [Actinomycetota bacterium]|nr:LPXTG cell wall anchor domain-containing protein [Actinomycetota bacterium]